MKMYTYAQKKMSFKIKEHRILYLPVSRGAILTEAIRIEKLFASKDFLTDNQYKLVLERYRNLYDRDSNLYFMLHNSFSKFCDYQLGTQRLDVTQDFTAIPCTGNKETY